MAESRFDEIKKGLEEIIEYQKGNIQNVRIKKYTILPTYDFKPSEIKEIRNNLNMTQKVFAECMGVTAKSIEAWEGGRSKPDGAAKRILTCLKNNSSYFVDEGIICYNR